MARSADPIEKVFAGLIAFLGMWIAFSILWLVRAVVTGEKPANDLESLAVITALVVVVAVVLYVAGTVVFRVEESVERWM